MAKVTLICGMLCTGKTTLAGHICAQTGAVLLSCDALMLALFPEDNLGAEYETYAARAKEYLLTRAEELLARDVDVVLDWGFWTRAERASTAARFSVAGIQTEWLFTDVSVQTWQQYIETRNQSIKNGCTSDYLIDEGLLCKAKARFEPLSDYEMKLYATFS